MRLDCSWHHHWLAGLKGVTRFRVQILSCLLPWNPVLCFTLYLPTEGSGDFLSDNRDGSLAVLPLAASSWCGVLGFLPFCLNSKIFKICAWIPHSKSLHVHFGVQYPFQIFPWSLQQPENTACHVSVSEFQDHVLCLGFRITAFPTVLKVCVSLLGTFWAMVVQNKGAASKCPSLTSVAVITHSEKRNSREKGSFGLKPSHSASLGRGQVRNSSS